MCWDGYQNVPTLDMQDSAAPEIAELSGWKQSIRLMQGYSVIHQGIIAEKDGQIGTIRRELRGKETAEEVTQTGQECNLAVLVIMWMLRLQLADREAFARWSVMGPEEATNQC